MKYITFIKNSFYETKFTMGVNAATLKVTYFSKKRNLVSAKIFLDISGNKR